MRQKKAKSIVSSECCGDLTALMKWCFPTLFNRPEVSHEHLFQGITRKDRESNVGQETSLPQDLSDLVSLASDIKADLRISKARKENVWRNIFKRLIISLAFVEPIFPKVYVREW